MCIYIYIHDYIPERWVKYITLQHEYSHTKNDHFCGYIIPNRYAPHMFKPQTWIKALRPSLHVHQDFPRLKINNQNTNRCGFSWLS